jgi:gas vesicle protein
MNDHNDSGLNAGHVFLALMGGALAGAGVAYLTAPAAGIETRHRMRVMAHDAQDGAFNLAGNCQGPM